MTTVNLKGGRGGGRPKGMFTPGSRASRVINFVAAYPGSTLAQIHEELGGPLGSVSDTLFRLARDGYLVRTTDEKRSNVWVYSMPAAHAPENTQLRQAKALIDGFNAAWTVQTGSALKTLDALLDSAQNAPPNGASDGTLSPGRFNRLRAVVRAGEKFMRALADSDSDILVPGEEPF